MAEEMTPETRRAFLTTGTRTAILATTPTKIVALDRVGEQ